MKILKLILVSFAVITFTNGCKKYDEGPVMTLRSAKARLVNDWRKPLGVGAGDVDCRSFYINGIEFFKNNTFINKLDGQDWDTGTWEFKENETVVILTFDNASIPDIKYKIIRLTRNDLWAIKTCTDKNGNIFPESEFRCLRVKK